MNFYLHTPQGRGRFLGLKKDNLDDTLIIFCEKIDEEASMLSLLEL